MDTFRAEMVDAFSLDEIRSICYSLGVKYDDLPGETLSSKVQSLCEHMERIEKSYQLARKCAELRPGRNWLLT